MFDSVEVLDVYGNKIEYFTQWDVDQTIKIVLHNADENLLNIAPKVHFGNVSRSEALVVPSRVEDSETIVVTVPNLILTDPYTMRVYVYITDYLDVSSQKTVIRIEIPVKKRPRPSDYEYVENIERITWETMKQELQNELSNGSLPVYSITFIDIATNNKHRVFIENNKLKFEDMGT